MVMRFIYAIMPKIKMAIGAVLMFMAVSCGVTKDTTVYDEGKFLFIKSLAKANLLCKEIVKFCDVLKVVSIIQRRQ